MYTIILFALVGFLLFPVSQKEWDWDELGLYIIVSIVGAFAGFIIALILPVKYETTTWSENIVSLKDNQSVHGSFFLGCGMINGTMKYVYYQQNNDSTYQMWQSNYYQAKIRYTTKQPQIDIYDKHKKDVWWNKFGIDIDSESGQTYVFEIPQGSIKNSYELDAQ